MTTDPIQSRPPHLKAVQAWPPVPTNLADIEPCPVWWCDSRRHAGVLDEDSHFARGGGLRLSRSRPDGQFEVDVDVEQPFDGQRPPAVLLSGDDGAVWPLTADEADGLADLLYRAAKRTRSIDRVGRRAGRATAPWPLVMAEVGGWAAAGLATAVAGFLSGVAAVALACLATAALLAGSAATVVRQRTVDGQAVPVWPVLQRHRERQRAADKRAPLLLRLTVGACFVDAAVFAVLAVASAFTASPWATGGTAVGAVLAAGLSWLLHRHLTGR